jgi:hypothetical protein
MVSVARERRSQVSTGAETKRILSINDLAERWGCSKDTVIRRVESTDNPIPFFGLGSHQALKRRREIMRFRIESIELWERNQERTIAQPEEAKEPAGRPASYTGKIYSTPDGKRIKAKRTKP